MQVLRVENVARWNCEFQYVLRVAWSHARGRTIRWTAHWMLQIMYIPDFQHFFFNFWGFVRLFHEKLNSGNFLEFLVGLKNKKTKKWPITRPVTDPDPIFDVPYQNFMVILIIVSVWFGSGAKFEIAGRPHESARRFAICKRFGSGWLL